LLLLIEDVAAGDIAGHQVGGELDALGDAAEDAGEGADHEGLAEAGHALDEHVAAGEHADEHGVDDLVLAEEDAGDLAADAWCKLRRIVAGSSGSSHEANEAGEFLHEAEVVGGAGAGA
jgi:hypothetical protein